MTTGKQAHVPLLRPLPGGGVGVDQRALLPGAREDSRRLPPEELACRAQRVQLAGAALNQVMVHPAVEPFEYMFRRLPEQGVHGAVSPQNPFRIELGGFRVPEQMSLFIFDFQPRLYRFSGADPNDTMPFEDRRFSTQVGYAIFIDGIQPANLRFELQPIPRQVAPAAYVPSPPQPGQILPQTSFDQAAFNRFGASAGSGLATLPQRTERYGARDLPLCLYVRESQVFEPFAIFWRPVLTPIAFIEFDFAGILMPRSTGEKLLDCLRPT